MTSRDLAQLILLTQDIREDSWDDTNQCYERDIHDSAEIAKDTLGITEEKIDQLVGMICSGLWNDSQVWALEVISENLKKNPEIIQSEKDHIISWEELAKYCIYKVNQQQQRAKREINQTQTQGESR